MPNRATDRLRARRRSQSRPRRARRSGRWRSASARASRISATGAEPGYRPDGNCRACMVEIEGERVLAASCMRKPRRRHEGAHRDRARDEGARAWCMELLVADQPARETSHDPTSHSGAGPTRSASTTSRFPAAARWAADRSHPAMRGQSRRLHPVRPVRARLPRGAGQRRDRHGLPQRRRQDRVRLRRPDGRSRPASPAANACRPARPAR